MNIDVLFESVSNRNLEAQTESERVANLAREISGTRNNISFLKSEIVHLQTDFEYDPDYPALLETIHGELIKMLDLFPERYRVVVEVSGGVAEVTTCPDQIDVEIIDHDNETHA